MQGIRQRTSELKDPTKFLKAGTIEDLTGEIDFVAFHKTLQEYNSLLEPEKKVIISGKYQKREEGSSQIVIESVKPVDNSNIITIALKKEVPFETIIAIKDSLIQYKGTDPLVFKADNNGEEKKILASPNFWLSASNDLTQKLEKQFSDFISVKINSLC